MTTRCTVCRHPGIREIDALLLADARSMRSVARSFLLHEKAVQRHVANHLSSRRATTSQDDRKDVERRMTSPTDAEAATVDPAGELRAQLAELNAIESSNLSATARIDLFDARRRTVEALAKIEPVAPASAVTFRDVDGMAALFETMLDVLEPHLELRLALLAQLRERGVLAMMQDEVAR